MYSLTNLRVTLGGQFAAELGDQFERNFQKVP